MSCQTFLARKTGIAQPNICKWQQDEAKYIAAAGDGLKKGLFKKDSERRLFRDAEHALRSKLMDRRKKKAEGVDRLDSVECQEARVGNVP